MPTQLDISTLETWLWDAACAIRGRLTLNTELSSQPAEIRREVIVHELVHLKLGNGSHNTLFRSLVRAYLAQAK